MSNINNIFSDKKAYVGYLTVGDGGLDYSLQVMQAYADSGVDIIEVGVPFSDPVADGPVIQAAAQRAIDAGCGLKDVLGLIKNFKTTHDTPVILFGYLNPILQYDSFIEFFRQAGACGVDGCLIVDLPLEESASYHEAALAQNIDPIYLIAPSTPSARIGEIAKHGRGMLYYACRKGVTGVRDGLPEDVVARVDEIKSLTDLPVVVGFGISDSQIAAQILQVADGFVVGSKLVASAAEGNIKALKAVITSIDPR